MALEIEYASRNVGDIFYTLRMDGALNGAVSCDGSEFSASDFDPTGVQNPYNLCIENLLPNVDYVTYDSKIKSDGCCAYFGVDTNTGKFRVPTLVNVFIESGDISTLAKYLAPGIPNITGYFQGSDAGAGGGAFAKEGGTDAGADWKGGYRGIRYNFNASRVSPVYGGSSTVQPKAIMLRPMVQLVTSAGLSEAPDEPEQPEEVLKIPYVFAPGTEAKSLEVNANFDYVLRKLKAGTAQPVVYLDTEQTITGIKTFTEPIRSKGLELYPWSASSTNGGYVDFHFDNATADYTARIIESVKGYLSINQDPPSGDYSQKIATTKWAVDKINSAGSTLGSLASNGWTKLPNGLIIQWGSGSIGGTNTEVGVNLPLTFPNAFFNVVCSGHYVNGSNNWDRGLLGARIASNSSIIIRQGRGNADFSTIFYYIAIGR